MTEIACDICVIGAGSAGLSIAAGAAQLGARTVLIEKHKMGGDCLNTGCVPSKSLLAAAKAAHNISAVASYGIVTQESSVSFPKVMAHVKRVIAAIAPHDSEERFRDLGCTVLRDSARFVDDKRLAVGGDIVRARRFVVATGSSPNAPPIPGLDKTPYLTNETVFDLFVRPTHLLIIGAGPIGCEMAQAFRRLGVDVTLLEKGSMMPKDDPEAVEIVRQRLISEQVRLIESAAIERVDKTTDGVTISLSDGRRLAGSHLLIAAGRKPNLSDLGLEAAGVKFGPRGIEVNGRLQSSNKRIYAAGDIAGGPQFTHWAGYHAGIIIRNALFRLPARVRMQALPWVTYTDPELAQVGMTEADARQVAGSKMTVLRADFSGNDRAQTESHTEGFAKAFIDRRGRILGATIVGAQAGELIQIWGLAISASIKIGKIAGMVSPYPTLGEINKRLAGSYYTPTLFSRRTRWVVRMLGKLG